MLSDTRLSEAKRGAQLIDIHFTIGKKLKDSDSGVGGEGAKDGHILFGAKFSQLERHIWL